MNEPIAQALSYRDGDVVRYHAVVPGDGNSLIALTWDVRGNVYPNPVKTAGDGRGYRIDFANGKVYPWPGDGR